MKKKKISKFRSSEDLGKLIHRIKPKPLIEEKCVNSGPKTSTHFLRVSNNN